MSYTNASSLVSTEWLAAHLDDPKVKVIDSTGDGRKAFLEAHIPRAVFFDFDEIADRHTDLLHMLPPPELFAEKVGALGIGNDDHVVAYDSSPLSSGARGWWMFRVFGHDRVSLLDGGLPRWTAEGRPAESGQVAPAPARYKAGFRPELVRSIEQLLANVETGEELVVDARAAERFAGRGKEKHPTRHLGHIPHSVNVPYTDLLEGDDHRFRTSDELERIFDKAGVDARQPVVTSCGSGVTACVVALGLHLLGHDRVAVYDGSWSEWGNRDDTPVET
ncbi:MAG: 3-mercaptopyruvate sulfurtransferase [Acetobacterales bacterium]